MRDMPFFRTNKEWYYYDFDEKKYKLTDKATDEAKKSYEEYYRPFKYDKEAL